MVDTFIGSAGAVCGQIWPSCAYWLSNTPSWNVYRKSHNVLWPVTGPLEGFVNEEIHHDFPPWTEQIPPGDYRMMKGWIHTSDITWVRDLYAADLCTGALPQNLGQTAINDMKVEEIDLSGTVAGGVGGGDAPAIVSAQILKGSDLPGPLSALVCDAGVNGGTPMPPVVGDLDPNACRFHPEHWYFAVEATDDFELWEDAKWFAFDKEYWGDPEREQRLEVINDLLIACAEDNWDSAVRGCLLSLYDNELTAEERLNICYWGDAIAAAWVDDPPIAPDEPTSPIPGPVAGWADPVSINHDRRADREHGWWVVNIPAPLCCKASWYMVVRDKAANWRRSEPVDLPAQLVPSVTVDQQTNVITMRFWGYPLPASPSTQGGYANWSDPAEEALRVTGRSFNILFGDERQYINLGRGEDLSGPGWWGAPQIEQRGRRILFGVQGSAREVFAAAIDHQYDSGPVIPLSEATNPSDCIEYPAKNDVSGWRTRPGDNARVFTCDNSGPPTEEGCFLEQDPGNDPTARKPTAECFRTIFKAEIGGVTLWDNTDPAAWHTLGFETSTFASDNYRLALCACDETLLDDFVKDYYASGPKEPEDEAVKLGSELQVWRFYWLWDIFPSDQLNLAPSIKTFDVYNDAYMRIVDGAPRLGAAIHNDGQHTTWSGQLVNDPGWVNEDLPPAPPLWNFCVSQTDQPAGNFDLRYAHSQEDINGNWAHFRAPPHRVYAYHGDAQLLTIPPDAGTYGWVCPVDVIAPRDNHLFFNWSAFEVDLLEQPYPHELGHILGLEHNSGQNCQGFPGAKRSLMWLNPPCLVMYVSLKEVVLLRRDPAWE